MIIPYRINNNIPMKPLTVTIALFFITSFTFGQQISRSTLTSSGDFSTNENGISLSWTMGGSFTQTVQTTHHITEGFQQGELSTNASNTTEDFSSHRLGNTSTREKLSVELLAYPNPTIDKLSLRFETSATQTALVIVTDLNGKQVLTKKVQMENGVDVELENIEALSAGMYFINVIKNGKIIVTKEFIKVER